MERMVLDCNNGLRLTMGCGEKEKEECNDGFGQGFLITIYILDYIYI